jgi:hypothetical protein
MRIVATKRSHPNPTLDHLGYLQALLVEGVDGWEAADSENLPTRAEVFVKAKFDEGINKKFVQNELIVCDVSELGLNTGDCMYGAVGTLCSNLLPDDDVFALLDLEGELENQENYTVQSILRPTTLSFLRYVNPEGEEAICGPMKLISSSFNETESVWESRLGIVGGASRQFSDLKPYSVYTIPTSNLPAETIKIGSQFHSKGKNIAIGLSSFIRNVPVEQRAVVSDATLIKILDDALLKNSKLGRRGKRDAIAQIEASKSLNDTMKPALLDLFSRLDQQEDENKKVIFDVLSKYKLTAPVAHNDGDDGVNNDLKQRLEDTKQELEASIEARKKAEGELKVLNVEYEKNKNIETEEIEQKISLEFNEKVAELESELNDLRKYKNIELEINELTQQHTELKYRVSSLTESEVGLKETVARLQSELALTTGQFREKALSVLPFLEIMNNVKGDYADVDDPESTIQGDFFVPTSLSSLVSELSKRVQHQGYQADATWLDLVSTLYVSNKFIGFFGSPGTGKTTIAKCYNNALGIDKLNCDRVKVGRGWSSFVDFIGYDNSFTGRFKYKDAFYRKFENENLDMGVFYSIIFDEATLSSPEFYLSSFIDEGDPFYNDEREPINLDGHTINLPRDTRFVLTFNVDETTERLSDRFISRMPIVYLNKNLEVDEYVEVNYSDFLLIDKRKVDQIVRECEKESEQSENLLQEYDSRLPYWNKIMPEKLGTRKTKQIRRFLNLSANLEDVDPTVVLDFVEEVFLLPFVKGDGDEFRERLEETIPKVKSAKARQRLGQIKNFGQRYNIYRHC